MPDGRLHGLSHGLLATWPAKRSCNKTPGLERSHRFLSENSCRAGGKLRSAQSCGDNTIATEENRRRGIRSTKMTTLSPPGNRTGAVYRVRTRSHTHRLPMSTKVMHANLMPGDRKLKTKAASGTQRSEWRGGGDAQKLYNNT